MTSQQFESLVLLLSGKLGLNDPKVTEDWMGKPAFTAGGSQFYIEAIKTETFPVQSYAQLWKVAGHGAVLPYLIQYQLVENGNAQGLTLFKQEGYTNPV